MHLYVCICVEREKRENDKVIRGGTKYKKNIKSGKSI